MVSSPVCEIDCQPIYILQQSRGIGISARPCLPEQHHPESLLMSVALAASAPTVEGMEVRSQQPMRRPARLTLAPMCVRNDRTDGTWQADCTFRYLAWLTSQQ